MLFPRFVPIALSLALLASCRPKPLDIEVAQKPADLAITSTAFDAHTVAVAAAYSITSLANLTDTSKGKVLTDVSKDMLVDSALVTIAAAGQQQDTLVKRSAGLFVGTRLDLQKGVQYTLIVKDLRKGKVATAVTTYHAQPLVDTLVPEVVAGGVKPVVKLHMSISNVGPQEYYMIYYTTAKNVREATGSISASISAVTSFVPKRVELFTSADAISGRISKHVVLNVEAKDTLMVHCGQIDEAYYNYLAAYKRSGYLINQISGEPINLPSNINPGLGFFSLYAPKRELFLLKNY